jgi:hypothetical protein
VAYAGAVAESLSKHTRLSTGSIPKGHKGERELMLHKAESIIGKENAKFHVIFSSDYPILNWLD